jgi:hypothetical protein
MKVATLACLAVLGLPLIARAETGRPPDLATRARGADRVVVATVLDVTASFAKSEFGDQLIVSRVVLQVEEVMKGRNDLTVEVAVEGGTVGDLTMSASDMPSVKQGERGVFFLKRSQSGLEVPHLRGLGILKLDSQNRVRGTALDVDAVRTAVRGAGH